MKKDAPLGTARQIGIGNIRADELQAFELIVARRGSGKVIASATIRCAIGDIDVLVLNGGGTPFACVPGYKRDSATPARAVRIARCVGDAIVRDILARLGACEPRTRVGFVGGVAIPIPADSALARSRRRQAHDVVARRANSARWFTEQERAFKAARDGGEVAS